MKKIAILGSTGSIGTQTLDIVSKNDDLQVVGIAAGRNIDLLEKQIRQFSPRLAAVGDEKKAQELKLRVQDTDCKIVGGMEGLIELAVMEEAEILVTAIVGMIGICPTVAAICAGKAYCSCKQRNPCNSRAYYYASCKRAQCENFTG